MSSGELKAALLDRLATRLAPLGYHRVSQDYRKEAGPSRLVLHIAFIDHPGVDLDLTADVAVRHHAVEEALAATRPNLSPAARRETATVGAELGNLAGTGQHRWTLARPTDIEVVANGVMDWFLRIGQPFLQRFAVPEETLRVLATDDALARLICPFPDVRAGVREQLRGPHRFWRRLTGVWSCQSAARQVA